MGRALSANNRRLIQAGIVGVFMFALLSSFYPSVVGQETVEFTQHDRFEIPQLNSSIRFAYNGTYMQATLKDNTWHFRGLTLNSSGSRSLGDFSVSVRDSNITIFSVSAFNASNRRFMWYYAEGAGQQIFDLCISGSTHISEWWVMLSGGVFLAPGRDWQLLDDNVVAVNGQTGNVFVVYNDFGLDESRNVPFVEQHSVALSTAVILAVTVTAAALLRIKRGRLNGY